MKYKNLIGIGLLVLALVVIGSQGVNAQGIAIIKGYTFNETGVPFGGVNVTWENATTSEFYMNFITGTNGYYTMVDTYEEPRESLITASKVCYITNSTTISMPTGSTPTTYWANFTLQKDITPPTITNLQPPDDSFINNAKPTISANYSDTSGINVSSVEMRIDGNIVTPESLSETGVSYTPAADLDEGSHTITVNVSDNCTNPNSTSWSFTVDTIAPTIEFIEPPTPANNTEVNVSYVNVSVNVTDYTSGINNATVVMVWNETGYPMTEYMYAFTEGKYYCVAPNLKNGNYTYWVQADDFAGNMNVSETRVVKVNVTEYTVSVTLKTEWNMFGVPLNVNNWTLPTVLESIGGNYNIVLYYNATSGETEYFDPLIPGYSTLKELEPLAGYWIDMKETCTLECEGMKFPEPSKDLESGWNMFSVPYGVANETLPTVLSSIEGNYNIALYYNATSGETEYFDPLIPGYSTLKELKPGAGYWIDMKVEGIFMPDME